MIAGVGVEVIVVVRVVLAATVIVLAQLAGASYHVEIVAVHVVAVLKGVVVGKAVVSVPAAEDLRAAVLAEAFAAVPGPWSWDVEPCRSMGAAYGPLAAWELEADTDHGHFERWCGSAESKTVASAACPTEAKRFAELVVAIHQVAAVAVVGDASFAARRAVAAVGSCN